MPRNPPSLRSTADLHALQSEFATALFRPLDGADQMRLANTATANRLIKPNPRLTAFERLEIYNRQYWFRLLDCLYEDFPGLCAVLGQPRFHRLITAYLTKYPSASFTLRNLGSRLEGFLRDEPKWAGRRLALALDMVRFEWAQIIAFDNSAWPPIAGDALLGQNPAELTLTFQPHITFLALSFPVDEIVLAIRQRTATRANASNAVTESNHDESARPIPLPRHTLIHLAVHRHALDLYYKRLDPEAFVILTELQRGATLEAACLSALSMTERELDWPTQLRGWFETWSALGWFCHSPSTSDL